MSDVEARRLSVPFNVLKPAKVDLWLIPSTAVTKEEGTPLAVLVDFDSYKRQVLAGKEVTESVLPETLVDRRAWAAEFGVQSEGRLVTFSDLSRYGWGLKADSGQGKASYWTVMFSQTIMRQLAVRMIGCEMSIAHKDAAGEPVDAKKWVKTFRKEVRAYQRIKPLGGFHKWVQREVIAMWHRITERLVTDENRNSLAFHLKQSNVVVFRSDRRGKSDG